jgi:hypothetical protein
MTVKRIGSPDMSTSLFPSRLAKWQVLNFPGIPPFSISDLTSKQPIHLTLYSLEEQRNVVQENHKTAKGKKSTVLERHFRSFLRTFVDLELSHALHCVSHRYFASMASQCRDNSPILVSQGEDSRNMQPSFLSSYRSDSIISVDSEVKDNNDEENEDLMKSESRPNCISSMDCLTTNSESAYDLVKRCTRNLCLDHPLVASP